MLFPTLPVVQYFTIKNSLLPFYNKRYNRCSVKGRREFFLFLHLLFVVLQRIELVVPAVVGQQLLMGTLFQNLPVGQDDDVVGVLICREGGTLLTETENC